MKVLVILLVLIGFVALTQQSFAWCMENQDWKDAPCYAPYQNFSKEKIQNDWAPYYDYKGQEFMDQKKLELMIAIRDGYHEKWYDESDANSNVFRYYYAVYDMDRFQNMYSPHKQLEEGFTFEEIQCKQNLVLVQKYDGSPACVTVSTKQKLIERGWTAEDLPFTMITQDSSDATFYVQSSLSSVLLKQGNTINLTLFSYIKESPSDEWDHVFNRAFKEVPDNFRIGIVQNLPENIKLFATTGKQVLPTGLNAEFIRDGGYFVIVLSSNNSLSAGEYDLSIVTVGKENGMTISKPISLNVVKGSESSIQDNIIQIQHSKHPWGIYLENISEQEYWNSEDRRLPSPPNPILEINDSNIHPDVKKLINAMWSTGAEYVPSEYDKNTLLVENVNITNVEPSEIRDWLKNTSEQQFNENLDGSTTHYFEYDDRLYSAVFSIAD